MPAAFGNRRRRPAGEGRMEPAGDGDGDGGRDDPSKARAGQMSCP